MKDTNKVEYRFIQWVLIILLLIFLYMIREFLVPLLLGIIFASLLHPTALWFQEKLKMGKGGAAGLVTLIFLLLFIVPSFYLVEQIINEGIQVGKSVIPFVENQINAGNTDAVSKLPDWFPFKDILDPYTQEIYAKMTQVLGKFSSFMVSALSSLSQSTAIFVLHFLIMAYAIFSFMKDGDRLRKQAQKILPLSSSQFDRVSKQAIAVSRATLKGALVIGLVQGFMMGLGFVATGLPSPVFWGAVTVIASMIPGIGAAIIYIPASIYLLATGQHTAGIGLLLWGLGGVGSIDNFLRPALVGKDVQMSDLMVLVSTLGGIGLFGISGIVLGPLVVGLLTVFINFSYEMRNS